ncbi:MAG TPA: hypothetical protein VNU71_04880 [Burkholderiaceae bacterium]|nr:hypothetical protein [Burkholderiaceae bacterium]
MSIEQLMGRYFRLQQELSIAYNARPWHSTRIDRLAGELAATEREIASQWPDDVIDDHMATATPGAGHPTTHHSIHGRASPWH